MSPGAGGGINWSSGQKPPVSVKSPPVRTLPASGIQARDTRWRVRFPALLRERAGDDPIAQLYEGIQPLARLVHGHPLQRMPVHSRVQRVSRPARSVPPGGPANTTALRGIIDSLADAAGIADPDGFAEQYSPLMQGAIVTEMIDRENRAAGTAAAIARVLIERALAGSGTNRGAVRA
jgi:hypothetical protein